MCFRPASIGEPILCPNCGKSNMTTNKKCRGCGESLEGLIAENNGDAPKVSGAPSAPPTLKVPGAPSAPLVPKVPGAPSAPPAPKVSGPPPVPNGTNT